MSPCLFHHDKHDVTIMVHGDDFVAVGQEEYVVEAEKALKSKYKIKTETLGLGEKDVREVNILNKVIRIDKDGLELEADPRHIELIVRELGLEGCRPSKTPGSKTLISKGNAKDGSGDAEEIDEMNEEDSEPNGDRWSDMGGGGVWRRKHTDKRRSLFTPSGSEGSP